MVPKKPHILFLFSDTGGGHRSAAEAIIEAIDMDYGRTVTVEMVDIFKEYAPRPLNRMPDWYPYMVKAPQLWGASFHATNGRARARTITATMWPVAARAARALINNHPSDLVVTVHPLATSLILKALGAKRPPFITVVTDMVSTHALWYDRRSDLILVPTSLARDKAIGYGMPPEKIQVVGQPVAERYCRPGAGKEALRAQLGWPQDRPVVLMVGGGEGMGPLAETASAIGTAGLDICLVVVTGRNTRLKAELEARDWPIPVIVYGFTRDMPDFMRAADVLVSKAGPGTIAEGLNAGLPIILFSRLPGQEDGNVKYVIATRTGVWAPGPEKVVRTLTRWVNQPAEREKVAENCRRAARPDAAHAIARAIAQKLGLVSEKAG